MNDKRTFQGIWIPAEIWLDKELSVMEKLFLVEIKSLDDPKKGCWAGNQYFADFFGVSKGRCTQIIKTLESKGLVKVTLGWKGKQIISRQIKVINKLNEVFSKLNTPIENIKQPYLENDEENNTKSSNTKSNKRNSAFSQDETEKADSELENLFNQFWTIYPNKAAKTKALAAFKTLLKVKSTRSQTFAELMSALNKYIMTKPEWQNTMHASTFINKDTFKDYSDKKITETPKGTEGMSYKEISQKLDRGNFTAGGWAAFPGEETEKHRQRVISWLKVGLDKHWNVASQEWIGDTGMLKNLFNDADIKARAYS